MKTEKQIKQHLIDLFEFWDDDAENEPKNLFVEGQIAAIEWVLDGQE